MDSKCFEGRVYVWQRHFISPMGMASLGLDLKLVQCYFCHILLAKAVSRLS